MSTTIIIIFAFYALTHGIKESTLLDKPRIWLIRKHVFFYQLFSCYFCVGFHSGWMIYLIANTNWNLKEMFLWALASAGISYTMNAVNDKLLK